ncbi:metalloendoproteinase 1-like [Malus domestica]|uniref:metalloendoproteinase 1-like n=1 Tax=Malus domestica TaxID=3750 RepID=UPI000498FFC9
MAPNILCNRLGALLFLLAIHAFAVQSVQNEEGKTIGLDELRSYLRTFGYLNDSSSKSSSSLEFDEVLETALKSFQKIYHLNVTAFDLWAKVTKFTFHEVGPSSPADILISFQRRDHGDGIPFDGPGKVLAHPFAPTDGRLHLDADENWSFRPPSKNQYDLVWVATHELGHVLGLMHSTFSDAIMYAYVGAGRTRRALHSDDIAGIKALYHLQP